MAYARSVALNKPLQQKLKPQLGKLRAVLRMYVSAPLPGKHAR